MHVYDVMYLVILYIYDVMYLGIVYDCMYLGIVYDDEEGEGEGV